MSKIRVFEHGYSITLPLSTIRGARGYYFATKPSAEILEEKAIGQDCLYVTYRDTNGRTSRVRFTVAE